MNSGPAAAVRRCAVSVLSTLAVATSVASASRAAAGDAAIAAPDRYGALAAREVLRAGGNAVDAAVATGFALAVTYPEAGNLGGGGFMTLYVDGRPYFLDYRETAPGAATATMYLDPDGVPRTDASIVGNLAVGVPGTVRGLYAAHARFGKLSWARDLAPAIRYAQRGFLVTEQLAGLLAANRAPFVGTTNFDRYYHGMRAGRLFRQRELAATLRRIAAGGDEEFYAGLTADLLVAQMARGTRAGLITRADLARYRAVWREPLREPWNAYEVVSAPPPSSGGIALLQMLRMKQDAAAAFAGVALNSPQYMHLTAEIEKRVFADRAEYLGDPDFERVPVAALLDPNYLAGRAAQIDPEKPTPLAAVRPGLGAAGAARPANGESTAGDPAPAIEKPQTTHYSILDRHGNAVANTYTLNGWFGAGVVVEGAGFLLNDEMDDFSVKPGVPNQYGVVGADANAIAPFKRPLSSMTPTILLENGRVTMILGTPGGSRIFTSVYQVLADVYDFQMPLQAALDAPRFHHQLLPENTIYSEPFAPFSAPLAAALAQRGYRVEAQDYNGDIEAIEVVGGKPIAAADPRARGAVMVVH
jgi:gamma-glutamyltranspeptidase/glutathione hydrolase